ncbi:MAG: hypothetical protein M9921_13930, partial [Fimbriimonadaceae bacterium]|nr:hypothetical protein [Fimbriimonadaceae bacterium]
MFAGIAILTLGLLKLVINMVKMLSVKRHLESYAKWLKEGTGAAVFENRGVAIRLLEEAGVTDASLPYAEPIGFGQVATSSMSVFENYPANRKDLVIIMVQKFQEAIGTYRSRSLEAINP